MYNKYKDVVKTMHREEVVEAIAKSKDGTAYIPLGLSIEQLRENEIHIKFGMTHGCNR